MVSENEKKHLLSFWGGRCFCAFLGGASADAKGGYPQSCASRMTAPSAEGVEGDFASAEARRGLSDRPRHPFGLAFISLYCAQRWQVAAALSAAVTTTKQQETAHLTGGSRHIQKQLRRTPAALRERGSGGEALLSEKRPLPQNLPNHSLFGREREGGGFSARKAPSLARRIYTPNSPQLRLESSRGSPTSVSFWRVAGIRL